MSWRASLNSRFKQIRFYVSDPGDVVTGLDLLKRNPSFDPSTGLREFIKRDRNELLMLNQDLVLPCSPYPFRADFQPKIEFWTTDFKKGLYYCAGFSYEKIESQLGEFFTAIRDGKPQNIIELKVQPDDGGEKFMNYMKRKSPIFRPIA